MQDTEPSAGYIDWQPPFRVRTEEPLPQQFEEALVVLRHNMRKIYLHALELPHNDQEGAEYITRGVLALHGGELALLDLSESAVEGIVFGYTQFRARYFPRDPVPPVKELVEAYRRWRIPVG